MFILHFEIVSEVHKCSFVQIRALMVELCHSIAFEWDLSIVLLHLIKVGLTDSFSIIRQTMHVHKVLVSDQSVNLHISSFYFLDAVKLA